MNEGAGILGFVIALALCAAVIVAQILASAFGAVNPGAAF